MQNKMFRNKITSILVIIILIFSGLMIFIPLNLNLPCTSAASTWAQTSRRDFSNGTIKNLTLVGSGAEAEFIIDYSDLQTWTQKSPIISPPIGYFHSMASIWGDDKVLLFGGNWYYGGYYYYNETWIYDYSDNTWTRKFPAGGPTSRRYHAMASLWGDDKIVLYGGYTASWYVNETWIYDLSNNTWTEMNPPSSPPRGYYPTMAPIYGTDNLVLFGGPQNIYNQTWVYDLSKNTWEEKITQIKPSSRYYHSMASIWGNDKVVLFGGRYGNYLDDTWIYDLDKNTWTNMNPSSKPLPRQYQEMASIWGTDQVMMFGGWNNYYDETWIYDLSANTWKMKILTDPLSKPTARYMHGMATLYGTDKLVLYGGQDTGGLLGDTWIYKHLLSTRNGTYISSPHDTGSKVDYNEISWFGDTPANTSIRFQIRTATNLSLLYNSTFVGPSGKSSEYYTSSPTEIWSGHDGDKWIQYKAYLNIKEFTDSPRLKDVTVTYNCLPNVIVIGPVNGSILTNNNPTFTWTFDDHDSEEQKAFHVKIDNDISFGSVDFDSGKQTSAKQRWEFPSGTSHNDLPDGTWYWKVRSKDVDGAWTEYSLPWSFTIDTHLPSSAPVMPSNEGFYNKLDKISGIATDSTSGSGINNVEITIKRLSDNNYWTGSDWAPIKSWLTVSGINNWVYNASKIPWKSGSKYNIQSRATDNATNVEVAKGGNIFIIDMDTPKSTINSPIDNAWVNNLQTISGSSVDIGGSGINKVEISIMCSRDEYDWDGGAKLNDYWNGIDWNYKESWVIATGTHQWLYNTSKIKWSTGNHYIIKSRAIDNAINIEIPDAENIFWYDEQKPEPISIYINNDDEFTRDRKVSLFLTSEDFGSGVSEMSFSTDGKEWIDWEPFESERAFTLPPRNGENTVYFRVRDYANNIANLVADSIILDTIIPKDLSILINENAVFTNSKNIKLDLYAVDSLSGLGDMAFSFDGKNWISWEPFSRDKSISLPPNDGDKSIYFRVKDKAGNIAEPVSNNIILDTTPPHSLSIFMNNGELITNSTSVILNINAIDNISGVSQISFSPDGINWSSWENFAKIKAYTLSPGDGTKIVYFKVKDNAGNIAVPGSTMITFKTPQPAKKSRTIEDILFGMEYWLVFIIIIIILVLIITALILALRRKKRHGQDLLQPGTLTIRPGQLSAPVISLGQVPVATDINKLPNTTSIEPQLTIQTPTLQPQQIPQTQLPQLPAAEPTHTTTPTTQPSPEPTISGPTPTVAQPTVDTTPAPASTQNITPTLVTPPESTNGPVVHLPESTPKPTIEPETLEKHTTPNPQQMLSSQEPQNPKTEDD